MFNSIWERYFLRQFAALFFLFLFCFFGLYVLIDYASHTGALANHHVRIPLVEISRYYLFVFASRAEILLPLALLIAFIKTVYTLNTNCELVALMAGGFKLKLLMRPFLLMGLACFCIMLANEQFLLPHALKKLRLIEDSTKHQKHRHSPNLTVRHLVLEDGSLFLYQAYDHAKERFFDAYWMPSIDTIYRIKYLSPTSPAPTGYLVDHLVRDANGSVLHQASYPEFQFPTMKFNRKILQSTLVEPDILPLSDLVIGAFSVSNDPSEKESKMLTALYWKLAIPWLCILAIIAPAPFCMRFARQHPIFLIYMGCLFGLIAFYMLLDAAQVVAKRQVIAPHWAIGVPFLSCLTYFSWRYNKILA